MTNQLIHLLLSINCDGKLANIYESNGAEHQNKILRKNLIQVIYISS